MISENESYVQWQCGQQASGFAPTPPAKQRAAPKAAQVEPDKLMRDCLALLEIFDYEDDEDSQSKAFFNAHINADWFFHVKHSIERQLEAKAAPQQEAQEPVGEVQHLHELNDSWLNKLPIGTKLYTAPQPAQALSDVVVQKTWALLNELEELRGANRDEEDWDTLNKRDDELRAALTAQRGKV